MLKNRIVYDYNIVNICFKGKAKKDYVQMRVKCAENFRLRGGTNVNCGDRGGGQPLDGFATCSDTDLYFSHGGKVFPLKIIGK